MADWENRSSRSTSRGASGGISPSEERKLKSVGRQQPDVAPYPRRDFGIYGPTPLADYPGYMGLIDATGRAVSGDIPRQQQLQRMQQGQERTAQYLTPRIAATRAANVPVYHQQYPQITSQFRDLIADPRTGQMHEATVGPYAGPTISPAQWMSQHPLFQLGNMFARMSAAFAPSSAGLNYSDPFQAPPGVDRP